ncbi:MAG: nuclear transport factor 2 family protein, partial [Mycobacterium sp.]|nr:nuclear transport factor 2 family protein [Mycobacterium sp.]
MNQTQIPELVSRWAEAERNSDARALDALMTDDCTVIGPRGFVLDRQQCLDRYDTGALRTDAFDWSDVSVRNYGATS